MPVNVLHHTITVHTLILNFYRWLVSASSIRSGIPPSCCKRDVSLSSTDHTRKTVYGVATGSLVLVVSLCSTTTLVLLPTPPAASADPGYCEFTCRLCFLHLSLAYHTNIKISTTTGAMLSLSRAAQALGRRKRGTSPQCHN